MNVFKSIKRAYYRVYDIYRYQSVGFTEIDELVQDFRYYLSSGVRGLVVTVLPLLFLLMTNELIRIVIGASAPDFGFIFELQDLMTKILPFISVPLIFWYLYYLFLAWRIEKLIPLDLNKSNRIAGENNHV